MKKQKHIKKEKLLLGFETLIVNKNVDVSWSNVKEKIEEDLNIKTKQHIGGDEQRISSINTIYSQEKYTQISLPIWIAAYKFNNKTYRVSINGQTGKIDGERPYSIMKITFLILSLISSGIIAYGYTYGFNEIIIPLKTTFGI